MPTKAISFGAGQASGYDELIGATPAFINAVPEGDGFRARPGLKAIAVPACGSAVQAMAVFGGRLVFVAADRNVYTVDANLSPVRLDGATANVLGTAKPTIYSAGDFCLIAGGSTPQVVTKAFASVRLTGTTETPPPSATDIAMNTSRIVAITEGTDEFYWSGPIQGGITDWDTELEFASAEARPDYNVAIRDTANELWLFGKTTTQIFQPDPDSTYAPAVSNDVGCAARDSVVRVENMMAWLDDKLRFQLSDGRTVGDTTDISKPIKTSLEALVSVGDCWGFRARISQHDLLIWVFPTAGKTFCYDIAQKAWCEFRGWANGRWVPFAPTAYCWWQEKRMHVVGMPDGSLRELTFSAATDQGGQDIPWRVRTGYSDHGENNHKDTQQVQVRVRPTLSSDDPSAAIIVKLSMRWRDDLGSFCDPVTMESARAAECTLRFWPVGAPYVTRQYEFAGDAERVAFVASAKETMSMQEEE